jgi:hypothetical protein
MKTIEEEFPPEREIFYSWELEEKYEALRARAAEMERNLHSVVTTDHERKEEFIARVREIIFPSARP